MTNQTNHGGLQLTLAFDPRTCRHTLDGQSYVMHCHHYAALYTQLAEDCGMLDGKQLLADVAEETFHGVLSGYFARPELTSPAERFGAGEQYFRAIGMGLMKVTAAGPDYGEVTMPFSHLDAGWVKKWGNCDRPVNHLGRGFIAALFAAAFDRPRHSYAVTETVSIAAGAAESHFSVVAG